MKIQQSSLYTNLLRLAIVLVSLLKLTLIGQGFMAYYDERRYFASGKVLDSLASGEVSAAFGHVFSTLARPGYTILSLIPTGMMQLNAAATGRALYEIDNAWPLFVYNYLIYLLILFVVYRLSLVLLNNNKLYALFSVLVYACLAASHISLRHADPYDASLLVLYLALYLVLTMTEYGHGRYLRLYLIGFLAFFGFSIYPGYVLLFLITPTVLFLDTVVKQRSLASFRPIVLFAGGSFSCLLIYEILAQIGGTSYIRDNVILSTAITQGDFSDTFRFMFDYLAEAENITGIALILGVAVYFWLVTYKLIKTGAIKNQRLSEVILVAAALFIAYASWGYFFEKVVWYARLIKQFLPLIVIMTSYALATCIYKHRKYLQNPIIILLALFFMANFYVSLQEYRSYYYPRDIFWQYYNKEDISELSTVNEYKHSFSEIPEIKNLVIDQDPVGKQWLFVNFCGVFPFNDMENFHPFSPVGHQLMFSGVNALRYKPYQFEAYSNTARKNLDSINLTIRVYKKHQK